jgi:hypothetical protein
LVAPLRSGLVGKLAKPLIVKQTTGYWESKATPFRSLNPS